MKDAAGDLDAIRTGLCDILKSSPFSGLVPEVAKSDWSQATTKASRVPVCDAFPDVLELCADPVAHPLFARPMAALVDRLGWVADYPSHPVLKDRFGHAVLYASDAAVIGCNLTAAGTAYPAHAHLARELYLPITDSGALFWHQRAGEAFRVLPGDLVYHEAEEAHALRTSDRPALNLWLQFGDAPGGATWFVDAPDPWQ